MPTHEERLVTVEYGLKQFQTETIKAYQDVAMELTMIKGLTEDAVRRLMMMKVQIDQQMTEVKQDIDSLHAKFDRLENGFAKFDRLENGFANLESRFSSLEKLIIDRLPPTP